MRYPSRRLLNRIRTTNRIPRWCSRSMIRWLVRCILKIQRGCEAAHEADLFSVVRCACINTIITRSVKFGDGAILSMSVHRTCPVRDAALVAEETRHRHDIAASSAWLRARPAHRFVNRHLACRQPGRPAGLSQTQYKRCSPTAVCSISSFMQQPKGPRTQLRLLHLRESRDFAGHSRQMRGK